MQHTTNYSLPQWEDTDVVKREDVNGAMASIDAAIAGGGGCRMAFGTYRGTSNYGQHDPTTLTFDFEPKLVIVQNTHEACFDPPTDHSKAMLVLVRGLVYFYNYESCGADGRQQITWSGNSVSWWNSKSALLQLNHSALTYAYIAFG